MRYAIHRDGDTLILELYGKTWGDLAGLELKDEVSAALALGRRRFVLDLSRVDFLTSMGVGIVVAAWSSIRHTEATLVVCGIGPRVKAILQVSGLAPLLDTAPTREEAVRLRPRTDRRGA